MSVSWKWGLILGLYLLGLFALLPIAPNIIKWLKSVLEPESFSYITGLFFFLSILLPAVYFLLRKFRKYKSKSFLALFLYVLIILAIFLLLRPSSVEKVHILEYGILSYLLIQFFSSMRFTSKKSIFFAVLPFQVAVALSDEIVQGILPNRFYDVRDIWMNVLAGTGILLVWLILDKKLASKA